MAKVIEEEYVDIINLASTYYDKVFVDKIKLYNDIRLVIFVHDLQKLMFDSEQSILDTEISILNKADVLILPSVKMHEYMINNGLRDDIQVLYQKIWEVPGFPCFKEHQNLKKMLFTGNWNRFPFLESYHGKTIVEHFDYQKPPRDDDSSFTWRNGFKPIQLMRELSKGGYGLVWCDKEYLERYYSMNQPHKLGFTLSLLSWERGLKLILKHSGELLKLSLLSWERGLKYCCRRT